MNAALSTGGFSSVVSVTRPSGFVSGLTDQVREAEDRIADRVRDNILQVFHVCNFHPTESISYR
jgi:hypothetical protein